jgi:hypothetical protein
VGGGWYWCRGGREVGGVGVASGSQREAAGFGRRLAHGRLRGRGKAGASKQAVCQGEMGSRGERRRQTSNAERVKGGERWQTCRRSALWLREVVVVMM